MAVLVDKNRIKSGIFAIEHLGCDTLLLDDGMQYLKLAHELDIVLVDCGAPFGTGAMLPRGTLREPRSSLARASYIILTKCGGKPQDELISAIRKYNPVANIIVSDHGPRYLENVFTGERLPLKASGGNGWRASAASRARKVLKTPCAPWAPTWKSAAGFQTTTGLNKRNCRNFTTAAQTGPWT